MDSKKLVIITLLFVFASFNSTEAACKNGDNIFTTYLGTTNFWGTIYPVWSNADVVTIFNNTNGNPGENTPSCNQIVPSGVQENYQACWIATGIPPNNTQIGVINWGGGATITNTFIPCIVTPVSIDDYTFLLVLIFGIFGFFLLRYKDFYKSLILQNTGIK